MASQEARNEAGAENSRLNKMEHDGGFLAGFIYRGNKRDFRSCRAFGSGINLVQASMGGEPVSIRLVSAIRFVPCEFNASTDCRLSSR